MTDRDQPPELSRPVDIDRLAAAGASFDVSASAAERGALAERFGLLSLDRLEAKVSLRRSPGGGGLRLAGHLIADLTQACVITLEPVAQHVDRDFALRYAPTADDPEVIVDADAADDVEPLPDGPLDIGEAVAQELVLALDPYPRAPGAQIDPALQPDSAPEAGSKPFAGLEKLTKKGS